MPNWKSTLGGAASGAAAGTAVLPGWGTAIGGVVGALPGLFDNSGDDYDKMLQLYKDTLDAYKGPESQPGYGEQMAGLGEAAKGGLNAGDRAAMLESYWGAANMAKGREGAIEQNARAGGGGYAFNPQATTLQAVDSQGSANRYQQAGQGAAGIAANRGTQARLAYLDQLNRNAQSMNNYRLHAADMLGGGYRDHAGYEGANAQASQYNYQGALDAYGRLSNSAPQAKPIQAREAPQMYHYGDPGSHEIQTYFPDAQQKYEAEQSGSLFRNGGRY